MEGGGPSLEELLTDAMCPPENGDESHDSFGATTSASRAVPSRRGATDDKCAGCRGPLLAPGLLTSMVIGVGSEVGAMCMWCGRVRATLAPMADYANLPKPGHEQWVKLQVALQVLVLQGIPNVTGGMLLTQAGIQLASGAPDLALVHGGAAASSSSGTTGSSAQPSMLGASEAASPIASPLKELGDRIAVASHGAQHRGGFKRKGSALGASFVAMPASEVQPGASRGVLVASGIRPQASAIAPTSWHDALPLTAEGLDGELPTDTAWLAVRRIRQSINMWGVRVASNGRVGSGQLQNFTSILKRMVKYDKHILGQAPTVNLEVGYRQLVRRIEAMTDIVRTIRDWQGARNDSLLPLLLGPLGVMQGYLTAMRQDMAADLKILRNCAEFHDALQRTSSLSAAVAKIDVEKLKAWVDECRADPTDTSEDGGQPEVPEPVAQEEDNQPQTPCAKGQAGKSRRVERTILPLKIEETTLGYVHKLMAEAMKIMIATFPADLTALHQDLQAIVTDYSKAHSAYTAMNLEPKEDFEMSGETIYAMRVVFSCVFEAVREAHNKLHSLAPYSCKAGEVAKCILSCKCGALIMEVNQRYSAIGIEDDAADKHFLQVSADFNEAFDQAFEDIESWAFGSAEHPTTTLSVTQKLDPMASLVVQLAAAVKRWSNSGLEKQINDLGALIGNMCKVVGAALHIMLQISVAGFKEPLALGTTPIVVDAKLEEATPSVDGAHSPIAIDGVGTATSGGGNCNSP